MPDRLDPDFYSDEAQDIMGSIPPWVVRWGVTVIAAIFAGIVIGCCIIKYPQTVSAPITITTENPPSDLVARYSGLLDTVCVADGESVERGRLIALLATPARYDDIVALRDSVTAGEGIAAESFVRGGWIARQYALGELQSVWEELARKCMDYRHYIETDYIGEKKRLLTAQIEKNEEYYADLTEQKRLMDRDMQYGVSALRRDSILREKGVLSDADYEISTQNYIAKQSSSAGFEATLTATELTILQTRQQLVELTMEEENEMAEYRRTIGQLRQQFLAQAAQWMETYAIVAPADGTVSLHGRGRGGEHITVGDVVASVTPDTALRVVGRMQVSSAGFGKIAAGQRVNVRLNGFPYMEYGVLRGSISAISAVPETVQTQSGTTVAYAVEVEFPDGLRSTYGKSLPFIQRMDGTGEIVTEDMRLIEQFIQPIVSLFKNR